MIFYAKWMLDHRCWFSLNCREGRGDGYEHGVMWLRRSRSGYLGPKLNARIRGYIGPL